MRVPAFEGVARLGAAALAALTITVPADVANRPTSVREGERKFDKRYLDRDAAFNPKKRTVAANKGEPDGADESADTGITPVSAAEEKFARRAYPTGVIPPQATAAAQET